MRKTSDSSGRISSVNGPTGRMGLPPAPGIWQGGAASPPKSQNGHEPRRLGAPASLPAVLPLPNGLARQGWPALPTVLGKEEVQDVDVSCDHDLLDFKISNFKCSESGSWVAPAAFPRAIRGRLRPTLGQWRKGSWRCPGHDSPNHWPALSNLDMLAPTFLEDRLQPSMSQKEVRLDYNTLSLKAGSLRTSLGFALNRI